MLQHWGQRWRPGMMHASGFDFVDVCYCNLFWLTLVNTEEITEHEMRLVSLSRHTHMQKYTVPVEFFLRVITIILNREWLLHWTLHALGGFVTFLWWVLRDSVSSLANSLATSHTRSLKKKCFKNFQKKLNHIFLLGKVCYRLNNINYHKIVICTWNFCYFGFASSSVWLRYFRLESFLLITGCLGWGQLDFSNRPF